MSVKRSLSYERGHDIVEGFIPGRGGKLVNYAIVFMVRGIVRKWKQAIAYFLSSSPMRGSHTKNHLLDCINRLQGTGVKVVKIRDQITLIYFEKQLEATVTKPYFEQQGNNRIFLMYDPPLLFKNIRNNVKQTWIHYYCRE